MKRIRRRTQMRATAALTGGLVVLFAAPAFPAVAPAVGVGTISGTVTDAATGLPVEGVMACAMTSVYETESCDSSDGGGKYEIADLPAGSYKMRFEKYESPYLLQYFDGVGNFNEASPVSVTSGGVTSGIDAAMEPGGTISGHVLEAGSGDPLNGIFVCAEEVDLGYSRCETSEADGSYEVVGLRPGDYKVRFGGQYRVIEGEYVASNYVPQYFDGKASWEDADTLAIAAGATEADVDAEMEEGGEVAGTVTDAGNHEPVESIEVCAYPVAGGEETGCGWTDSDGGYAIVGLAAGSYKVGFSPGNAEKPYARQYYDGKSSLAAADPVAITAGNRTSEIDAELLEAAKISGTVTSAQGGAGIAGIQVCAAPGNWEEGSYRCGFTSAGGQYTITGLQNGEYTVEFKGGVDFITQYYAGKPSASEAAKLQATEGTTKTGVDAQLQPAGKIKGKVFAADLAGPLQGAEVCASREGAEFFFFSQCTSTAPDGTYTLGGLASGSYVLRFSAGYGELPSGKYGLRNYLTEYHSDKPSVSDADPIAVTAGATVSGIDATLQPGGRITGTVTDAVTKAGTPAYVCVVPATRSGGTENCVSADEDGEYAIQGIRGGTYKVRFGPGYQSLNYLRQWYSGEATKRDADPIAVTEGQTTEGIDAELQRGGKISGTVTDAVTHEPIEGVDVCTSNYGSCDETGSDGTYALQGLPTGSFKLVFRGYGDSLEYATLYYHDKKTATEAQAVAVTAGQTTAGIDQEMRKGGRISGTVLDAAGDAPLKGISVCAWSPAIEYSRCATTDAAGRYSVVGLAASSYRVRFTSGYEGLNGNPNYVVQYYDEVETAADATLVPVALGGEVGGIDAALYEGGKIAGRITAAATGDPVKGAAACVYSLGGSGEAEEEFEKCAGTNASGDYLIEGLGAGSYKVAFYPNYYGIGSVNLLWQYYDGVAGSEEADPVSVSLGETTHDVDGALLAGAQINGVVTDSADGSPLQGVEACAYEAGGEGEIYACATTNSQGKYTIARLPGGTYKVGFTAYVYSYEEGSYEEPAPEEEFVTQFYDGKASLAAASSVNLPSGGSVNAINAKMVKAVGDPPKPANLTPPALIGEPLVGKSLSCSQGTWSGSPTAFAYRWLRDGSAISAQVANSYVIQNVDQGRDLACEVTASNSGGSAKATSNAVAVPDQGEEAVQRNLSVTRAGSGSGTVSSSPVGITCGATCSHAFADGTALSLSAIAAAGSTFVGWSGGGCSGTGKCQLTLGADATVTANFTLQASDGSTGGSGSTPTPGGAAGAVAVTPPAPAPKPKALKCRKGIKKNVVRGKRRCVKAHKPRRHRK